MGLAQGVNTFTWSNTRGLREKMRPAKIGTGTAAGALLGGAIGGWQGALIGAALGALLDNK